MLCQQRGLQAGSACNLTLTVTWAAARGLGAATACTQLTTAITATVAAANGGSADYNALYACGAQGATAVAQEAAFQNSARAANFLAAFQTQTVGQAAVVGGLALVCGAAEDT